MNPFWHPWESACLLLPVLGGEAPVQTVRIEGNPVIGEDHLRVLVDNWSIDVFAQEGLIYMPATGIKLGPNGVGVRTMGGAATFTRLQVHELGSIWAQ